VIKITDLGLFVNWFIGLGTADNRQRWQMPVTK
jgi:hypothetical protein